MTTDPNKNNDKEDNINQKNQLFPSNVLDTEILVQLKTKIEILAPKHGFSDIGFCDLSVSDQETALIQWLNNRYHGEMHWMENHLNFRLHPETLLPGALSAIVVRLDYLPPNAQFAKVLGAPSLAYISRYALGKDYHKILRKQLKQFAEAIQVLLDDHLIDFKLNFRPFVDSAPILERPLAAKAGLGFIGKHSLLINHSAGSWFFIGELLTNLPLHLANLSQTSLIEPTECGKCQACKTICPTGAIVEDFVIDARRCISYLTIEHNTAIPIELRPLMGNRIYGCDDCQLICPYNKVTPISQTNAFSPNSALHAPELLALWHWQEAQFLKETQGSPIRRIGFEKWRRNLAVAIGNIPASLQNSAYIINALRAQLGQSELVDEHIIWAITRHESHCSEVTLQQKRLVRSIEKGLPRDA